MSRLGHSREYRERFQRARFQILKRATPNGRDWRSGPPADIQDGRVITHDDLHSYTKADIHHDWLNSSGGQFASAIGGAAAMAAAAPHGEICRGDFAGIIATRTWELRAENFFQLFGCRRRSRSCTDEDDPERIFSAR